MDPNGRYAAHFGHAATEEEIAYRILDLIRYAVSKPPHFETCSR
jgi:hypothetical protein